MLPGLVVLLPCRAGLVVPTSPAAKALGKAPVHPEPLSPFVQQVVAGYAEDPWFAQSANTASLKCVHGLWCKGAQICVPAVPVLRNTILQEHHSTPYAGHFGVNKTVAAIAKSFWWPGLRETVQAFVAKCDSCQRSKARTTKPPGPLLPLPIPEEPWQSVSMDFITKLPPTARGHDAVLVFVDRLTKMVHLGPTTTECTAMQAADLFVNHVVRLHGWPANVISDRDSIFTSKFFAHLMQGSGVKQNMKSTAFHP